MNRIEQKMLEFEARAATASADEQKQREETLSHLIAINRFEGLAPDPLTKRLFALLTTGKVSKQEYLDLCLADALRRDS